jgi:phosphatidylserine decarboxylase
MTKASWIARLVRHNSINFVLTNRIPRRWLTRLMGRLSKVENPWVCAIGIAIWCLFADLDLSDARRTKFRSLHDCFTRELQDGARRIERDSSVLCSPSDAILGASGRVSDGLALQAKGISYALEELLGDAQLAHYYLDGHYVTLRLTSGMYHRFHAPYDCRVEQVRYFSGDTWNVNPAALERVERLFCRNERAVIQCRLQPSAQLITLVPVAAILVASIRLHFLDVLLHLRYHGPTVMRCDATLRKGEEMGWFEHGSTIILLAPAGFSVDPACRIGDRIRMGQALLRAES